MLSRDLWDSATVRGLFAYLPSCLCRLSSEIPSHELIDSSALGYDCLEKISGANGAIEALKNSTVPTEVASTF